MPKTWRVPTLEYPTAVTAGYDVLLLHARAHTPEGPFLLIAESYSTPLAIRFAAEHPQRLKGLVLCAGFAFSPIRGWRHILTRMLAPLLFRIPLQDWALRHFLLNDGADPELVSDLREAITTVKPRVLVARLAEVLVCDVGADLARVDVPILYLQAEKDRLVCEASLDRMLRIKPAMAVIRMAGPHLLFQCEPQRCAEAIVRWLDQTLTSPSSSPSQ